MENVTVPLVIAVKALMYNSKLMKALDAKVKHPVCDNTAPLPFIFVPPTFAAEKVGDVTL
jgi:hypothetical protein